MVEEEEYETGDICVMLRHAEYGLEAIKNILAALEITLPDVVDVEEQSPLTEINVGNKDPAATFQVEEQSPIAEINVGNKDPPDTFQVEEQSPLTDFPDSEAKTVLDNILAEVLNKFDTVYDENTGKYSLIVSRGAGKTPFSEEYTEDQTDLVIIAGAAGYVIQLVGIYVATVSTTGVVEIDFEDGFDKLFRLYASKYQRGGEDDFAYRSAEGEGVKLTSTTGANALFVAASYRKVAVEAGDITYLTVADFQANPATGTCTQPWVINDNSTAMSAAYDAIGKYAEVAFDKAFRLNKFRHYGYPAHNYDGRYKIQYFNLKTGEWTDWITEIPTRSDNWSQWQTDSTIQTTKVRIVATVLDTLAGRNYTNEWEMKYEA